MPAPIIAIDRGLAIDLRPPSVLWRVATVIEQFADGRPPRLAASACHDHAFHHGSFIKSCCDVDQNPDMPCGT
jgi:hypothetical protein